MSGKPYNLALHEHLLALGYAHSHFEPSYNDDWRDPRPF
jgi:hypothetical protein